MPQPMDTADEEAGEADPNEARIEEVLTGFLARRMAGDTATPDALLGAHPDIADVLRRRIASLQAAALFDPVAASPASSPATPNIEIPGLSILAEIGRGGMGIVYRARQLALGRDVAVKLVRGVALNPRLRERFEREASAMARIRHPHVAAILDAGVAQDCPYLVMPLIEGIPLTEWLPGTEAHRSLPAEPVEIARRVRLTAKVARALSEVHERGVIHRDVKPSNVLVAAGDEPVLIDFGLAFHDAAASLTAEGDVVGTLAYMAPEQALGRRIDARADVFGAAATLYHLLTGALPYPARTLTALALRIERGPPQPARRLNPALSRDLSTVLERGLAADPADRYASCRDLAEDLEAALDRRPIRARRLGRIERVLHWSRRRPAVAALVGVSIVAASLGLEAWHSWETALAEETERRYLQDSQRALVSFLERDIPQTDLLVNSLLARKPSDHDAWLLSILNARQSPLPESEMSRVPLSSERTANAQAILAQAPGTLAAEACGRLLRDILTEEADDGACGYAGLAVLDAPPDDSEARRLALVLGRTSGLQPVAESILLEVIKRNPTDSKSRVLHALLSSSAPSPQGLASAAWALADDPGNPYLMRTLALHYRQFGAAGWVGVPSPHEDALGLMRAAVDLAPADALILNGAGLVARSAGEDEEAEAYYRSAIALSSHPQPRFNLVNLLQDKTPEPHQECFDLLSSIEANYGHRPSYWDRLAWHQLQLDGGARSAASVDCAVRGEACVPAADRTLASAFVVKYASMFPSGPERDLIRERLRPALASLPVERADAVQVLDLLAQVAGSEPDAELKKLFLGRLEGLRDDGAHLTDGLVEVLKQTSRRTTPDGTGR